MSVLWSESIWYMYLAKYLIFIRRISQSIDSKVKHLAMQTGPAQMSKLRNFSRSPSHKGASSNIYWVVPSQINTLYKPHHLRFSWNLAHVYYSYRLGKIPNFIEICPLSFELQLSKFSKICQKTTSGILFEFLQELS